MTGPTLPEPTLPEPTLPKPTRIEKPSCLACGASGRPAFRGTRDYMCGTPGSYDYWTCPSCQLIWVSPQPTQRELLRLYEQNYGVRQHAPEVAAADVGSVKQAVRRAVLAGQEGYPDVAGPLGPALSLFGKSIGWVPPIGDRARYHLGLLFPPNRPAGKLLDIGCGLGWYVRIMRDWGWDACGLEPDGNTARKGREMYQVPIFEGDINEPDFPDEHFDAISIRHVLEHVSDPHALLSRCRRLLKPGGWLGIATPNGRGLASRWFGQWWRGLCGPWHLHLFGPDSLRKVLEANAYEVKRVRTLSRPAHWVYTASQQIRQGVYRPEVNPPSCWWFHGLEVALNSLTGDFGEELEAVAEKPRIAG